MIELVIANLDNAEEPTKKDANKLIKDMKIITAILLGKNRNKDLAKVLDTDKSFASKKIKHLEEQGLVHKYGEGKKVRYNVNHHNVLKFLQSKVVITTKKEDKEENEDGN